MLSPQTGSFKEESIELVTLMIGFSFGKLMTKKRFILVFDFLKSNTIQCKTKVMFLSQKLSLKPVTKSEAK